MRDSGARPIHVSRIPCGRARIARRSALLALLGIAAACSQPTEPRWEYSAAVVLGRVATDSGAPIAGAAVRIYVFMASACGPAASAATYADTITNGMGQYTMRANSLPAGRFAACVAVRATPPAGSALGESTVAAARQVLFATPGPGVALDSVHVDVTLPRVP